MVVKLLRANFMLRNKDERIDTDIIVEYKVNETCNWKRDEIEVTQTLKKYYMRDALSQGI